MADMGRHSRVRLITDNQSLTVVNLARPGGNLKKFSQRKKSREIMGKTYLISRQSAESTASISAATVSLAMNPLPALVRKGTLVLFKKKTKLSDKSSEKAELGGINGLKLGRHGILGPELTASTGKEGHAGPGENSQQNQNQPSCFELLISTQPNLNSKCRATIV